MYWCIFSAYEVHHSHTPSSGSSFDLSVKYYSLLWPSSQIVGPPLFGPVLLYTFSTQGGITDTIIVDFTTLVLNECLWWDFLLTGLKESSIMSHADSVLLAEVEDTVRKQIGVVYSQDG